MKQKKLAMLLALTLTFTQVAAVPVAAEDLTMYAVQEQESVLDDSAEEVTLDAEEEPTVEEDEELLILDDTEVTVDTFQAQEEVTDDSAAEAVVESETELMVEGIEEVSLLSDEGEESEEKMYGFDHRYGGDGSIGNNGEMLINSTMTLSMTLIECTDKDNNNWKDVEDDYTLEIRTSDENIVTATVDKDNKHCIVITSKGKTGFVDISVSAKLNDQTVFTEEESVEVYEYILTHRP